MKRIKKVLAASGLSSLLLVSTAMPANAYNEQSTSAISSLLSEKGTSQKKQLEQKIPMSNDTFTIKYSKPISAAEHRALGGTVVRQFSHLNYAEIKVKNKANLAEVMRKYQKLGKVESVSPSFLYKSTASVDPKASQQYQHTMLQIEKAQKLAGKNKITVAVVDTGTDSKHPDLKNALLPGYNAANPANQPIPMEHGTHVSGIIAAAKNNGIGGYGISPNVKILPVDVFDGQEGATDASIAEGILYAVEKGAKVINMSLGGPGTTPLMEEAVQTAIKKGVIIVAAAGNESTDALSYPAAYEGVISVGSINEDKQLSSYSNYGPSVDVVAPGENVYSTLYDKGKKSTFMSASGTSMASPVVAGVAGLLLTKYPKLTPAQVEYVLEKTADNLGASGFDTTYANGLVNPVRALSFDMKKLPTYVKKEWTKTEILAKAEAVDATKQVVREGAITKPFEQKWVKFEVKKGESIQTLVEGSKQYDYKIIGHFYGQQNKIESFEVNQTQDGSSEAKLIQAPFDATVVIGVIDVNASFDDSGSKRSIYKLTVNKAAKLPEDETTIENMIQVNRLPYKLPQPFTLAGEQGDYDYFKLKVDKQQLVQINLSAIPGLNTDIGVYNLANFFPEESAEEEQMSEADKQVLLKELLEGEGAIKGEFYANSNGTSQGETLTFVAEPDQEYIIKVAGDAVSSNLIEMLLNMLLGLDTALEVQEKQSSLLPYQLEIVGKETIEDEDYLSKDMLMGGSGNALLPELDLVDVEKEAGESIIDEQTDMIQMILENARPYVLGKQASGYIQNDMDEDYFLIEPTESALYQFELSNKSGTIPVTEILEIVEEEDEKGEPILYTAPVVTNVALEGFSVKANKQMYTGLQRGKRYIIKMYSDTLLASSAVSFDPYHLSSKKLNTNVEDQYEPSDYKNVKKLPGTSFKGNFAMPNDTDVFYYTANETGIKAISVEPSKVTANMKAKYQKAFLNEYKGVAAVIEDTNKNRTFDPDKDHVISVIQKGTQGFSSGSFKMVKGKSYLIEVAGINDTNLVSSIVPYTFNLVSMTRKDGSTLKKPINIKKQSTLSHSSKGYFNAGVTGGDTDYYNFELSKNASGSIQLIAGKETDGVISLYQNGKRIKQSDLYLQGDTEVLNLSLKKGKYQIRISDANGQASIKPYTLKVNMK